VPGCHEDDVRGVALVCDRLARLDPSQLRTTERVEADDDEVLYVLAGSGRATVAGEPADLSPGTAAFVACGSPWQVDDAPADFIAAQMKAIVGVEIPILAIEGKWKMSQNRPERDRLGVIAGFREAGEAGETMAALVAERGGVVK